VERFRVRLEAELLDTERVLAEHVATHGPAPLAGRFVGFEEFVALADGARPLTSFLVGNWPDDLPEPVPVDVALQVVREDTEEIARQAAAEVEELAGLFVPDDVRSAVLARHLLVKRWAWPLRSLSFRTLVCLDGLGSGRDLATAPPDPAWRSVPGGENFPRGRTTSAAKYLAHPRLMVPDAVALLDVLTWAREPLARLSVEGRDVVESAIAGKERPPGGTDGTTRAFTLRGPNGEPGRVVAPWALGVLYEAWRDVELNSKRRHALALDANDPSRSVLEGMVHMPKDTRKGWEVVPSGGYYELAVPGEPKQYALTLPGVHMSEAMQGAIRTLRGPKGVRHWLAFHVGFTVAGRRSGALRWTVEDHLDALQVPLRQRRRSEIVEECVGMAELFLRLELLRRPTPHAKDFTRAPIFHVRNWNGREAAGRLRLDGVDFGINPWLYGGVRKESGELGENFAWAPAELAGIDHVRHPYAVTLGPVLAIRWRIAYAQDGRDFVKVSGENVLRAAGADKGYKARDPGRTWHAIARDLEELQRLGALGDFEWDGPPGLRSNLTFHMPTLMRDRMLHGVRPLELTSPVPTTGAELKAWREDKGLSQVQLAALLGVVVSTVSRGERRSTERLPTPFRESLRRLLSGSGLDLAGAGSAT
jgi:DNA-binding transcriptional regulator YiaG